MANQVIENRRANGRAHIERNGSVGKVAAKMDYANPSFLVQIFGPTPTRTPTEKTAHRIEDALKLPRGTLDQDVTTGTTTATPVASAPEGTMDADMLAEVIMLVQSTTLAEAVDLVPKRFATVTAMALQDSVEHEGQPRAEYIRSLVRLLKG